MLNFSTIPPWMFEADEWVPYPEDPDQPIWNYQVGTELRDPSLKEVAGLLRSHGSLVHQRRVRR